MALRVNTNIEAINVHNNLVISNNKVAESLKRLPPEANQFGQGRCVGLAVPTTSGRIFRMRVRSKCNRSDFHASDCGWAYSKIPTSW